LRDQVENFEERLEKAMIDGMGEVLNGLSVEGPYVPLKVETQIAKTWSG
jgi:hypothetical protein